MRNPGVLWLTLGLFILALLTGCAAKVSPPPRTSPLIDAGVSPVTIPTPLVPTVVGASKTPQQAALSNQVTQASPLASPKPVVETRLDFDGELAFQHAVQQLAFGDRQPGSVGNRQTGDYIVTQLSERGWQVEEQTFEYQGTPIRNVIGRVGEGPVVILGAHYDTRRRADRDPNNPSAPVPGANDGASGVAVLLELARALDKEALEYQVWLAFFDAEDNGGLDGWEWIVGSSYMAQHLTVTPKYVIIVDMIGDADQQIYFERNSDPQLSTRIWDLAAELGYGDFFLPSAKHSILDDHTPFARRGIPAVDIIDFDYPHWHTTADTLDKISPLSLERVGRVLETLLEAP